MFCSKCGAQAQVGAVFCSSCGNVLMQDGSIQAVTPSDSVSLDKSEMRVPVGSMTLVSLDAMGDSPHVFSKDSSEAKNANAPFDPSQPPVAGDLVPLDCVWAFTPHPGPPPKNPANYGSVDKRMVALGPLRGRTMSEIMAAAGQPMTNMNNGISHTAVWGKTSLFGIWQIGLNFDSYGVCIQIYSQTNI